MKKYLSFILILGLVYISIPRLALATPTYVTAGSLDITLPSSGAAVDNAVDSGTGSDRIMIIFVSYRNSAAQTITSVSYGGSAATAFGAAVVSAQMTGYLYYLLAPATGSNTLSVDPSTSAGATLASVSWMVFSDVDQTTPYDGYTTGTGTDTNGELTVTSETGDTPFFTMGWRGGGATGGTPTNYTERFDNTFQSGAQMVMGGEGTGAASVSFVGTVDGEFANTGWVTLGANLNAVAGGGGGGYVAFQEIIWYSEE